MDCLGKIKELLRTDGSDMDVYPLNVRDAQLKLCLYLLENATYENYKLQAFFTRAG